MGRMTVTIKKSVTDNDFEFQMDCLKIQTFS